MNFDFDKEVPIFMQIAEQIESGILAGIYAEESQIPSTTEVSLGYQVNPATVLKGMNLLVDDGLIYKKRGIGMFVAQGAAAQIKNKRQHLFFDNYVSELVAEAKRLGISCEQLMHMIDEGMKDV